MISLDFCISVTFGTCQESSICYKLSSEHDGQVYKSARCFSESINGATQQGWLTLDLVIDGFFMADLLIMAISATVLDAYARQLAENQSLSAKIALEAKAAGKNVEERAPPQVQRASPSAARMHSMTSPPSFAGKLSHIFAHIQAHFLAQFLASNAMNLLRTAAKTRQES